MTPLRIFIGHDQRESVAYHVLTHSLLSKASLPLAIYPIKRTLMLNIHDRTPDPKQSNEFSFRRFLVPYLSEYKGVSLYMDCDMLCRVDIAELFALADNTRAVQVVQHDYVPKENIKYLGAIQHAYAKKNWSSLMLFNNEKCRALTPEYVNTASGLDLHQFKWLDSEARIGSLPKEWNHLVGEYDENPIAKIVHWTNGGPYFHEYARAEYAEEYSMMLDAMTHKAQRGGYWTPFVPAPKTEESQR